MPRYESAVRRIRAAAADAGGESGIRRRDGAGRPELVVVVVDDGMFAITVARTVSGDTPSVPGAQPARSNEDAAAIAPTRTGEGVIMPGGVAETTPGIDATTNGCGTKPWRRRGGSRRWFSVLEWRQIGRRPEDNRDLLAQLNRPHWQLAGPHPGSGASDDDVPFGSTAKPPEITRRTGSPVCGCAVRAGSEKPCRTSKRSGVGEIVS